MIALITGFGVFKNLPWKLIGIIAAICLVVFASFHIEHQAKLLEQYKVDRDQAIKTANYNAAALAATNAQHEHVLEQANTLIADSKARNSVLQKDLESLRNDKDKSVCKISPSARAALERLR